MSWVALNLRSRPRYVALILVLILTVGSAGIIVLPRLEDPTLSARFGLVKTFLPGADALRVETEVTEVLEKELQDLGQIRLMRSQSRPGVSIITLELKDHITDLESAWSEVREKMELAEGRLPVSTVKPELVRTDVRAYALIVALKWVSDTPSNQVILQRQAEKLKTVLTSVTGTEEVRTFGATPEEISILVDQRSLDGRKLHLTELAGALSRHEARSSTGLLIGEDYRHVIRTNSTFDSLDHIRRAPLIASPSGDHHKVESLAQVRRGLRTPEQEKALVSGKRSVVLAVYAEDHIRVDEWSAAAHEAMAELRFPPGLELQVLFEQNETVQSRLKTLVGNLVLAVVGVAGVVLVIMGWRAALVVGISIPLSSACVFGGLIFLGIPIHQMSVTGLIVALGLMIDNAIVVTDEMKSERDSGLGRAESIRKVVGRLTVPLFSSTATTVLVFLPIALLPGGVGEFVGSIAVTVILALISSLLLSLTLLPVVFLWLEAPNRSRPDFWSGRALPRVYRWLFQRPWTTVALALVLPLMGFLALPTLKEQFFPPTDRAQIRMTLELDRNRNLASTERACELVRQASLKHEEVLEVHWFLGRSVPKFYYNLNESREREPYFAEALVQLKSSIGTTQAIRKLQKDLEKRFPDYRPRVIQLEQGPPFEAPVEIHLFGEDLQTQKRAGEILRLALSRYPEVVFSRATLSDELATMEMEVDLVQARRAGLDPESVADFVALATSGQTVGTVFEDTEAIPVVLRLNEESRASLETLDSLQILGQGKSVPLSSLVHWNMVSENAVIAHRHQRRCNSVQAFLTAGTLPTVVLQPLLEDLESGAIKLPPGITYEIGGEAEQRNRAVGNLMVYVAPLAVLMLAALVVAFGSFRLAALVGLVGLLSAGSGFGMLALLAIPFGFNAIIGTMGLMGVAINDSTVVLTALLEEAPVGGVDQVAHTVARASRHVVATTFTTVAGFLPLLMGADRFWHPLAGVMVGGVVGASFLGLLFCPVVYLWKTR